MRTEVARRRRLLATWPILSISAFIQSGQIFNTERQYSSEKSLQEQHRGAIPASLMPSHFAFVVCNSTAQMTGQYASRDFDPSESCYGTILCHKCCLSYRIE